MNPFILPEQQYGTTLESLIERRERVAKSEGTNYGSTKMFSELSRHIMAELPAGGGNILEVDAGAGLFTRELLEEGHIVTAIEPVPLLCDMLEDIKDDNLDAHCGFVEDLFLPDLSDRTYYVDQQNRRDVRVSAPGDDVSDSYADSQSAGKRANDALLNTLTADDKPTYDAAVVSFPARRGRGILALICELLPLAKEKVILSLPDDGSVDWTSTMRAISLKGYKARAEFIVDLPAIEQLQKEGQLDLGQIKRSMLMIIDATPLIEQPLCPSQIITAWGASVRVIEVPYPVPRGAATRLIRYFKSGGDRSILIKTEPDGMHHLYGNLRTAAHRLARDQITVRRVDNGIQLMQIVQSEIPN